MATSEEIQDSNSNPDKDVCNESNSTLNWGAKRQVPYSALSEAAS